MPNTKPDTRTQSGHDAGEPQPRDGGVAQTGPPESSRLPGRRASTPLDGQQELDLGTNRDLREPIQRAARLISSWRRVLVTSHRSPDGDALGAALGLALSLRAHGCDVVAANADPPVPPLSEREGVNWRPTALATIPGADLVVPWEHVEDRSFDGAVLVDCGALDRLHPSADVPRRVLARSGDVVVIDHHSTTIQVPGATHNHDDPLRKALKVVDPTRASSAELIALVIWAADLPMDRDVATALLTGIATDTKGFLRESADARALALASRLRARGGEVSAAADILDRHNAGFLRLAGDVLSRARFIADAAGVVASIPDGLIAACRADDADVERLTTILSATREARLVVLLQEKAGEIRGSVRTRAPVDAVAIARHFGGGGHASRSGFRLPHARLEDVLEEASEVVRGAVTSTGGR